MPLFEPAARLAALQHGLVTLQQLRSAGLSERQVRTLTGNGVLERASLGVYVVAGARQTWEQRLLARVLAAGSLALASHRSAAGLWRLDRFRRQHADIITPYPAMRRPVGAVLHETNRISSRDRTVIEGIPVTTVARTLIDVSRYVGVVRLRAMLDDAVRRDLTTYRDVHQRFAELACRGRDGIATVRSVLDTRPDGSEPPDSPLEDDVRNLLVRAGIAEPVLHHRVDCDELTYVVDLAWPHELVGVECDGLRFHRTPEQLDWDDQRRTRLGLRGWLILHTTRSLLRNNPQQLVHDVAHALRRRDR